MSFDPYQQWLGIPPHEQPADHYRLLGLARFEDDVARIAAAADERMALIRSYQVGPRSRFTQKLLNELATAKVCLLSLAAKKEYDRQLAQAMAAAMAGQPSPMEAAEATPPPVAAPRLTTESTQEPRGAAIARPAGWRRPIFAAVLTALLLLAAALGWSAFKNNEENAAEPPIESGQPAESNPAHPLSADPVLVVQMQEPSGVVNLSLAAALLHGGVERRNVPAGQVLANWAAAEAAAEWRFKLLVPGFFELQIEYAATEAAADAQLVAHVAGQTKHCSLRPTGDAGSSVTDSFVVAVAASGEHTLVLRNAQAMPPDWLILKSVRLVPIER
ncbi:MAG: hypothetical protein WD872_15290 [Pirellulaceae bacterium]